jgi:N-acetylneuraminic acid mutarotase
MIVWGGLGSSLQSLNDGGVFDPAARTWKAMSTVGAPAARYDHFAAMVGSKMVVWGGSGLSTADFWVYDPDTDTWLTFAPPVNSLNFGLNLAFTASAASPQFILWGGKDASAVYTP